MTGRVAADLMHGARGRRGEGKSERLHLVAFVSLTLALAFTSLGFIPPHEAKSGDVRGVHEVLGGGSETKSRGNQVGYFSLLVCACVSVSRSLWSMTGIEASFDTGTDEECGLPPSLGWHSRLSCSQKRRICPFQVDASLQGGLGRLPLPPETTVSSLDCVPGELRPSS